MQTKQQSMGWRIALSLLGSFYGISHLLYFSLMLWFDGLPFPLSTFLATLVLTTLGPLLLGLGALACSPGKRIPAALLAATAGGAALVIRNLLQTKEVLRRVESGWIDLQTLQFLAVWSMAEIIVVLYGLMRLWAISAALPRKGSQPPPTGV